MIKLTTLLLSLFLFSSDAFARNIQAHASAWGPRNATHSTCRIAENRAYSSLETDCQDAGGVLRDDQTSFSNCSCFATNDGQFERCSVSAETSCSL